MWLEPLNDRQSKYQVFIPAGCHVSRSGGFVKTLPQKIDKEFQGFCGSGLLSCFPVRRLCKNLATEN